jgi:DNA repair exonuclease SbcCD ATPase subunit
MANDTTLDIDQLPEIEGHEDIEAARDALASARERLHDLEDRKAEIKAQIPELRDEVDDLRVEVATGDATDEDLQAARQAVAEAEDELERVETRAIPSQQQAVERLDERREAVLDRLGNEFAGEYQEAATELLEREAQALRNVAQVLDLIGAFDAKRAHNRIQNEYGPEIPSVPTLEGAVEVAYKDEHEPDELRSLADELQEQAARLREGE